ncbi:DUF1906 domain-containing protein [Corynebacterium sp. TAE3-ERU12]|uniref:glycoside hydrolase domain-containing protein n=1 Tax=Corynebacterium sp. TAE3-ERU12 TaxID=2849491 RepID=UPI001C481629|nr:glycoside hydrolase domain-containing protein [Corynebacterium sp. TAE3-ERU12]MBV7294939.1 DUF1906 domain-containing protein [Corynebacterium sp. TAE3-ERU12]
MQTVIDYSAGVPRAEKVASAGFAGAVRYISPPRESWMRGKPIEPAEQRDYTGHGLATAFVWQFGKEKHPDAMRGARGGELDAKAAQAQLDKLGCSRHPVFFAVDFDITLNQWNKVAADYFRAAGKVLGPERVGIYGHSRVIAWAAQDGVIAALGGGRHLAWQTAAWSHGERAPEAVLYQRRGTVSVDGVECDVNEVLHSFWGQHPVKAVQTAAKLDRGWDVDLSHMIPFGRPTRLPKRFIVVHTTENDPWTCRSINIVRYQQRSQSGSYHRLVDTTGAITLENTDDWQVWATANRGNDIALHVSLCARAAMTREQWLQHPKMLEGCARVIAYWCRTYNIPCEKRSQAEFGRYVHGVGGHRDARAWGTTDHTDPGPNFPYDIVLARARQLMDEATGEQVIAEPDMPEPEPDTPELPPCPEGHIRSLVDPRVVLTRDQAIQVIDKTLFEVRHAVQRLAEAQGIDYQADVLDPINNLRK